MTITFLGTGTSQGVPVIGCGCEVCASIDYRDKRLRSSVFVQTDGLNLIIDTGPDFRQQILRERIRKLDAVLFTHEHKDHTAGLDDIRAFNYLQKTDMPVFAREKVIHQIQREFAYIFTDKKYPGIPKVQMHEILKEPFFINDLKIMPIEIMHYRLPIIGFRIKDFTYITDANFISEEELEKIEGTKVLVLNALQNSPHISHFTLQEAIDVALKIKAEKTFFTHISHNLGSHKKVSAVLPENIFLGYDGLKVSL
ncbi:MAG TPA: MBL fold metallo-hydrolase [Cytophagales bacterium]|nr:MBL fold metallo-hydrolase [Cytophagales bacterium]